MGCDAHIIIERKIPQMSKWIGVWSDRFGFGRNGYHRVIQRDYGLFANLAGVRGSPDQGGFYKRGLPPDLSELAMQEVGLWATDGHSHTHMTFDEFKSAWILSNPNRDTSRDEWIISDVFNFYPDDYEDHEFRLILFFDN